MAALSVCGGAGAPSVIASDHVGDPLDADDFVGPAFAASFAKMPAFRSGLVRPEPARALGDPAFAWTAGYIHATASPGLPAYLPRNMPAPAFSWLSSELATYPNADAIAAGHYSPFSIGGGALIITADHTPVAMRALIPEPFAKDYISGAISSYPFSQTYGYFELSGRIPTGRGLWPAFWLMPTDMSWPPENDVMEVLGQDTRTLYTTIHSRAFVHGTMEGAVTKTVDLSQGDHSFGVDWGPTRVGYYLDRRLVFSRPTPDDWHKPFYLIANLAVGGPKSWPGAPDESTGFPARFRISSIRAWQRKAYLGASKQEPG
jgi:Glycosyl hydrolases family 16